ncbi:hypothetical protein MBLNU459_g7930t1 [Dothideomycetes sp. NU459]
MTSSLLSSHFEQMAVCASSIAALPFPGPRPFTNALLAPHDITALIRDTEAHERALFSIAPPPVPSKSQIHQFSSSLTPPVASSSHHSRAAPLASAPSARQPRRHTAVAAVLGGDLYRRTRTGLDADATGRYGRPTARDRSAVDVELLLEGAEKLCAVYPVPGALDRIARLRSRYSQLTANIAHYEDKIATQAAHMDRMYQSTAPDDGDDDHVDVYDDDQELLASAQTVRMTREDLRREEEDIRTLEQKKRALEERVTGMEKDIGGLMR